MVTVLVYIYMIIWIAACAHLKHKQTTKTHRFRIGWSLPLEIAHSLAHSARKGGAGGWRPLPQSRGAFALLSPRGIVLSFLDTVSYSRLVPVSRL